MSVSFTTENCRMAGSQKVCATSAQWLLVASLQKGVSMNLDALCALSFVRLPVEMIVRGGRRVSASLSAGDAGSLCSNV